MPREQQAVVSPGLKNLMIIEIFFLFVAVFTGIYIWAGMPLIAAETGINLICTVLMLSLLFINKYLK